MARRIWGTVIKAYLRQVGLRVIKPIHFIFDSKQLKNYYWQYNNLCHHYYSRIEVRKKIIYNLPNLTHINFFPSEVRYSPGSHLGRDKAGPGSPWDENQNRLSINIVYKLLDINYPLQTEETVNLNKNGLSSNLNLSTISECNFFWL